MLDILDKTVCDNLTMKKILTKYIGEKVLIEYNLGRNKIEKFEGKISKLYNALFLVENPNNCNDVKSFSYSDLITRTVKIYK
jgi:uncharacterized protein Veg